MGAVNKSTGNAELDHGLDWLCHKVDKILDFGCGDAKMLYLCAARGTTMHIGIDKSPLLIHQARKEREKQRLKQEDGLKFYFRCGSVSEFRTLLHSSVEAVILSGILDTLPQSEAKAVLAEVNRILMKDGKVLVKINDFLTEEQLTELKAKRESNSFWRENTGDGIINLTTDEWKEIFAQQFDIKDVRSVYYKDFDLKNRLFLLIKKP